MNELCVCKCPNGLFDDGDTNCPCSCHWRGYTGTDGRLKAEFDENGHVVWYSISKKSKNNKE